MHQTIRVSFERLTKKGKIKAHSMSLDSDRTGLLPVREFCNTPQAGMNPLRQAFEVWISVSI